jgi:hypothetical protein
MSFALVARCKGRRLHALIVETWEVAVSGTRAPNWKGDVVGG